MHRAFLFSTISAILLIANVIAPWWPVDLQLNIYGFLSHAQGNLSGTFPSDMFFPIQWWHPCFHLRGRHLLKLSIGSHREICATFGWVSRSQIPIWWRHLCLHLWQPPSLRIMSASPCPLVSFPLSATFQAGFLGHPLVASIFPYGSRHLWNSCRRPLVSFFLSAAFQARFLGRIHMEAAIFDSFRVCFPHFKCQTNFPSLFRYVCVVNMYALFDIDMHHSEYHFDFRIRFDFDNQN